jgi:hypothetical protein
MTMTSPVTRPDEESRDRVRLLEQAVAARDQQLEVREEVIRSLRAELRKARTQRSAAITELARVRKSRSFRLARKAALVAHPGKVARNVVRGVKGRRDRRRTVN